MEDNTLLLCSLYANFWRNLYMFFESSNLKFFLGIWWMRVTFLNQRLTLNLPNLFRMFTWEGKASKYRPKFHLPLVQYVFDTNPTLPQCLPCLVSQSLIICLCLSSYFNVQTSCRNLKRDIVHRNRTYHNHSLSRNSELIFKFNTLLALHMIEWHLLSLIPWWAATFCEHLK